MQEIVEDERSDRDETDDSEDEEKDRNGEMKKNGAFRNGYTMHNNNHHRKTHWRRNPERVSSYYSLFSTHTRTHACHIIVRVRHSATDAANF